MGEGGPQTFRREHFIAGDSMRGIAALWVLFAHVAFASVYGSVANPSETLRPELGELGPWVRHSHLAPLFFFTLSGYLIAQPFMGALVSRRRMPSVRRYAKRRARRIIPVFWLVFLLTVLVHGTFGQPLHEVLAIPLFGQIYFRGPLEARIVQAWTIDIEIIFYALVPLLALPAAWLLRDRLSSGQRASLVVGLLLVVLGMSLAFKIGTGGQPTDTRFHLVAYAFVPGVLLATLEPLLRPRLRGTRAGWIAGAVLTGLAVVLLLTYTYTFGDAAAVVWRAPLGVAACAALLGAPVVWQWATGRASRIFTNRPLQWIGERAYSIYLIHLLILSQVRFLREGAGPLEGLAKTFPIVLGLSFLAAIPLYRYVEVPFMEGRFPWRRVPAPAPPTATQEAPAR